MSESPTPESEAPQKVAKKKSRAKTARKRATKPSAAARPSANDAGSESAATTGPNGASGSAQRSETAGAERPAPREERPPREGRPPRDERPQASGAPADNGSSPPRRPDEMTSGRAHERGGSGPVSQENRGGSRNRRRNRGERNNHPQAANAQRRGPEVTLDPEELKAKAWHIYSTEVCEEGIRFVDDTDAGKLVRRCYKLAETFLRFQYRQQPARPEREETQASDDTETRESEDYLDAETPF